MQRDLRTLSPRWDVSITSLPSGLRDLCGRGHRKIIRARGNNEGHHKPRPSRHSRIAAHKHSMLVRVRGLVSSALACLGVLLLHQIPIPVFRLGRTVGFPGVLRLPVLPRGLSGLPCDLFLFLPRKLFWNLDYFLFFSLCVSLLGFVVVIVVVWPF